MTSQTTRRIEVLIVGAGQAGLATGHELAARRIPFLIVHADDRVGDQWRRRWASLRLYSPALVDGLPGMPFPAARLHFPSGTEMADYLEQYTARFDLPIEHGVRVERIERAADGNGFVVEAGTRRYEADQVIVATGSFRTPRVPSIATELDGSIRQIHSVDYRDPSQLAPGPVLVVGASHSGADIAHEAALAGHPTILAGRVHGQFPVRYERRFGQLGFGILLFLARYVLTLRTPIGRRMAVEVRKGGGPLLRIRRPDLAAAGVELIEQRVTAVVDGRPQVADGRVLDAATVVWSTGFRPDFAWVEPAELDADGWPVQRRGVVETAPGLYFVGLLFQYAFSSMLVAGVGRDARFVVEQVEAQRSALARGAPAGESARPASAA
jgi:putative flavoprotein involved in K+ transport